MRKTISRRVVFLLLITVAAGLAAAGCGEFEKYKRGPQCGGSSGLVCPEEMSCDYEVGKCGDDPAETVGFCVALRDVCDQKFKPVCACDGRTYWYDCLRLGAGQRKAHDGRCEGEK